MFTKNEVDLIDFEQLEKDLVKEAKDSLIKTILADADTAADIYSDSYLAGRGAE